MNFRKRLVNSTVKGLARLLCRIDSTELARVPQRGPLILVVNHVNFLDVPVLYLHLLPRPVNALIKIETWDDPMMAFLFNNWGGIPIHRGEADRAAFQQSKDALAQGQLLAVSPEGTRSGTGCLQRGKPGVALLAVRTGAPLLPIAFYGHESFRTNFKKLRRTPFHIKVGAPFKVNTHSRSLDKALCQEITDQIMLQLAGLLPERYHGDYAQFPAPAKSFLDFS